MEAKDITYKPWPRYPTGTSFFPDLIALGNVIADKTGLIEAVVKSGAHVLLFTRARRWLKSSNLSMLQHFLASEVNKQSTSGLFHHLKISQVDNGEFSKIHQGKYPVIFINFKTIYSSDFNGALSEIGSILSTLFEKFEYLLESKEVGTDTKNKFREILSRKANFATLTFALLTLTTGLFQHFNKKVYILVDEYDHPLNHALHKGFYEEMKDFLRGLYGACLKDNPYLAKGVLTGILRIAKAGIFSELNNVSEYSMLDDEFSEYFGFTEEELEHLIEPVKDRLSVDPAQIRNWYNGYRIGNRIIYNPWSIMNCLSAKGAIQPYWIGVSDNKLIESKLKQSDETVKSMFELLLQGGDIKVPIDFYINMEPDDNRAKTLWTLLLHAGYLTLSAGNDLTRSQGQQYRVCIPNLEVKQFYLNIFNEWFTDRMPLNNAGNFLSGLLAGEIERFSENLKSYLMDSFSYFDTGGKNPEKVYHAFVLGLIANLHKHYIIKSNRESGHGRFDILLMPHNAQHLGILFEFKSIDRESKPRAIQASTKKAMQQIKENHYVSEFNLHGIKNRLFVAITFAGKKIDILSEKEITAPLAPTLSLLAEDDQSPESMLAQVSPSGSPVRQLSHFSQYVYRTFGGTTGIRRQAIGTFNNEEIQFDIFRTGGAGHCGFYSLPIPYDRAGVVTLLLNHADDQVIRNLVADEIMELAISNALPNSLILKYKIIQEYIDFQAGIDQSKALLLTSVLDQIDAHRMLLSDYHIEAVLAYLKSHKDGNQQQESAFIQLQQFQQNYAVHCAEMRRGFSGSDIYEDFVRMYLGGTGHLSFSMGGLNFQRQTSSLDAILLAMQPAIRLYIWQGDPNNAQRLHLVYQGGRDQGTPTHVHHQGGLDSHFELMAESPVKLNLQALSEGEPKSKKLKTGFWSSVEEKEEKEGEEEENQDMDLAENDDQLEQNSISFG